MLNPPNMEIGNTTLADTPTDMRATKAAMHSGPVTSDCHPGDGNLDPRAHVHSSYANLRNQRPPAPDRTLQVRVLVSPQHDHVRDARRSP